MCTTNSMSKRKISEELVEVDDDAKTPIIDNDELIKLSFRTPAGKIYIMHFDKTCKVLNMKREFIAEYGSDNSSGSILNKRKLNKLIDRRIIFYKVIIADSTLKIKKEFGDIKYLDGSVGKYISAVVNNETLDSVKISDTDFIDVIMTSSG